MLPIEIGTPRPKLFLCATLATGPFIGCLTYLASKGAALDPQTQMIGRYVVEWSPRLSGHPLYLPDWGPIYGEGHVLQTLHSLQRTNQIHNRYPLLFTFYAFDKLNSAKMFTKLDLSNACHLV